MTKNINQLVVVMRASRNGLLYGRSTKTREVYAAAIVVLIGPTHFKCIKHRYALIDETEKIPIYLLKEYLYEQIAACFYSVHERSNAKEIDADVDAVMRRYRDE